MASDHCYRVEVKRAIERHERGEARVIPVILRPVYWQGAPLGKLQALPTDAKPVTGSGWQGLDEAFYDVAEGIRKAVEELEEQPSNGSPGRHAEISKQVSARLVPAIKPEEFTLKRTLEGHAENVNSIAISPDGQTLASGSWDKTIKVWNLYTGQLFHILTGHSDYVNSVTISSDGQTLASGSDDNTIKLWDLYTGQLLHTLEGHAEDVSSVVISTDGQTLAS